MPYYIIMGRKFIDKGYRCYAINQILNIYLFKSLGDRLWWPIGDSDGTCFDAGVSIAYKNEKGLDGGDPYLQNCAYYVQYWISDKDVDDPNRDGLARHCCPWILIEVLGQEMGLSGAVFADKIPCIQPLTCNVPFLPAPMNKHLRLSQLRLCMALRIGASKLKTWYEKMADQKPVKSMINSQAQFPWMRSFPTSDNGELVHFEYVKCEKSNNYATVFWAKRIDNGSAIVVKFVEQYGEAVHRELGELNMAPKILAVVRGRTFQMIVMQAEQKCRPWDENDACDQGKVNQLRNIQATLREKSYVHGDLRAPNILVCQEDGHTVLKLIDFDWSGKSGEVYYPVELNSDEIQWPKGASIGQPIDIAHDEFMLDQLLSQP